MRIEDFSSRLPSVPKPFTAPYRSDLHLSWWDPGGIELIRWLTCCEMLCSGLDGRADGTPRPAIGAREAARLARLRQAALDAKQRQLELKPGAKLTDNLLDL